MPQYVYVGSGYPTNAEISQTFSGNTYVVVVGGGALYDCNFLASAIAQVGSNAIASNTHLSSGGGLDLFGGVATSTSVSSGGFEFISTGSTDLAATVYSGGFQGLTGGYASGGVFSGGQQTVYSGLTYATEISSGGVQYLSGGAASATLIQSGGRQIVSSGAQVISTSVGDGGLQVVRGGNTTSETIVASGGYEDLRSGVADGTDVQSGGTVIFNGGSATHLTAESGSTEIVTANFQLGGLAYGSGSSVQVQGNLVSSGVTEIVASGGQDLQGVLLVGAQERVLAGGTATQTMVAPDATQAISNGGSALLAQVNSGGTQTVSAGGVANGTRLVASATQIVAGGVASFTVMSGANQIVMLGGVASNTSAFSGSYLNVSSGGAAVDMYITSSTLKVFSGGVVTSTTLQGPGYAGLVKDGEIMTVYSGGSDFATKLLSGALYINSGISTSDFVSGTEDANGNAFLYNDGTALSPVAVGSASHLNIDGGICISAILSAGAYMKAGSIESATLVLAGSTEYNDGLSFGSIISSGGKVIGIGQFDHLTSSIISSGGLQLVASQSTADAADIQAGGTQSIVNGGNAYDTIVRSGGFELVSSGGETSLASVMGSEVVSASGSALSIAVSSGGVLTVSSGGVASGSFISAGGSATIVRGGSTTLEAISSGGVESVLGSSLSATVASGGFQVVGSTGVASSALVLNDGVDLISSGGVASGATIYTGGSENILSGGVARATTVRIGAIQTVSSGGLASGAAVTGGIETVRAGGAVAGTSVGNGGLVLVSGGATGTIVEGDGTVKIAGGGVTSLTQVQGGGLEIVLAGGSSVSATVGAAGALGVFSGGTALDTTIGTGGLVRVASGGTALNPIVLGTLIDENGDPTIGAVISSGGVELVQSGADAVGTVVQSGGVMVVLPGALPTGTIVENGGQVVSTGIVVQTPGSATTIASTTSGLVLSAGANEFVLTSGIAQATTIGQGSLESVSEGGSTIATTINGGTLELANGTLATGFLSFAGAGGTLRIDGSNALGATLSGFGAGDAVDLTALAYDPQGTATLDSHDVLTISEKGSATFLQLSGDYSGDFFHLASDSDDTTILTVDNVPCYCSGTRILTQNGKVAVETLALGDLVVTASGACRAIAWLGHREVDCRRHPRPHEVMPIRIAAHAFGKNRPSRDLRVSPGHAICVDVVGEVLIPAAALVNGTTVVREEVDVVTYWHVELEGGHDILLAEDLPCESYLEMGNRKFFAEAEPTTLHASPDAREITHADFCRPFHQDGSVVAFVRDRLAARAPDLGWTLAHEPLADLHLVVDGMRIDPEVHELSARFLVPADAEDVWLVSGTSVPAEIGMAPDLRRLGVCISALVVDDGFCTPLTIPSDDPRLCVGFHHVEEGPQRWTAGRARLPADLWGGKRISFLLQVELTRPALPRWAAPVTSVRDSDVRVA